MTESKDEMPIEHCTALISALRLQMENADRLAKYPAHDPHAHSVYRDINESVQQMVEHLLLSIPNEKK